MQEISTPLLGNRRRFEDEAGNQVSSHNLVDRHRDSEEEEEEEEGIRTDYGSGVYRYPHYFQPGHFTSLEKLQFFSSSILFILLCIFVGLYARSSQQEDPILPSPIPKIPKNHTKKQIACLEPNCIMTAAQILQDVDTELDPCDDFYAYTCNKWKSSHLIPDAKSKIDIPSIMTGTIRHRLNRILSRDFDSVHASNLPDPNTILDRQLFTKLQDFYTSCMNQDMIEQKSVTPLYPLFRSIREFIPLSNSMDIHDGLNTAIKYLSEKNIWPLFEFQVEPDIINNPSKPSLYLSQGQVGLSDFMYEDPEMMKVYMQTVSSILEVIFKKDTDNEFGWKSWSTIATARRIIEFEKKIVSSFTTTSSSSRHIELWTMEELKEKLPQIDWTQQFNDNIPTHILTHNSFIDNLNHHILNDLNPRTLQMYFIWRVIWKNLDVLGQEFQIPKRKLDAKISGIEPRSIPERWETCIDILDKSAMGILLGRYYITDHYDSMIQSKKIVQDVAHHVINVLVERVPQLTWATREDQQEIMAKLKSIEFQVGFSNVEPNIESVVSLSEYFGGINMNKSDFFGNMNKSNKLHVKQQLWHALGEPSTNKIWNAQSVQVSYHKELNKVIIPGGLLQSPFIDPTGPAYFYYGTIGWMIGHEITHGFDTLGRKYNTKGLFGSWWHQHTIENLDSQNQCLIDQYNTYGIDGDLTLNNNYADLGGLSIFESLLFNNELNTTLPGLNDWTRDQLGYIQFARMKCSKSTTEHKKLNKHVAPDRLRVNGPLMNSNHFSSTFGCKLGSFMNPDKKKCQVW